jgi:copper oxidase (laccase) domain-containing protein
MPHTASPASLIETFPALSSVEGLDHGFVLRDPDTNVANPDRDLVLRKLEPHYRRTLAACGIDFDQLALAEQVHGDGVAVVEESSRPGKPPVAGVDGLITGGPGIALGIYVADCCPVWLVDPRTRATGLVHSGRKGSELGIAGRTVEKMNATFGSEPADLIVLLGPCIRPPNYEIDIAPMIVASCCDAGVPNQQIHEAGSDTATDLERYYSYRLEKGHTGRMLAFVRWRNNAGENGTADRS